MEVFTPIETLETGEKYRLKIQIHDKKLCEMCLSNKKAEYIERIELNDKIVDMTDSARYQLCTEQANTLRITFY